jgi:hypothetical protein
MNRRNFMNSGAFGLKEVLMTETAEAKSAIQLYSIKDSRLYIPLRTSPELLRTSPKLPWTSPKLLRTSPKLPWTSPKLPWTSPKLLRTSPKLLNKTIFCNNKFKFS